ncbi:HAD-IIB family hydrolase [Pseudanabaena sp. FACHB-1277]|jgi:sucrose-6F-phosphate phosphohydrolase|uniref:HAD-IIB family hydrolase n=1 Tax=Pseudanabaena cinerea FACHB-1277 TaxID=2949581 RepID=A0A926UX90_9CYAN|nr:HAD-IIB family hydrolase [Pseudanabaena cinerea]MBD2152551.1 HAD-IIB family hydrolase [Pseudanabaena cinerea FACHB-1277]
MQKLLICTDLDRTLLPNGTQPESPEARDIFSRLVSRSEVHLAYVSGRNLTLVQEAIQEYDLPIPDWVVGDVGSTMYQFEGDRWKSWQDWTQQIAVDWQGLNAVDLEPWFADLAEISHLVLQESDQQSRFKLSYYLPLDVEKDALLQYISDRLKEKNIAASLIYSVDEAKGIGLLDILPAHATKLHAVEFLMNQLDCDHRNTIFAGDSGNDLPLLTSSVPSILVANAHRDIIEQAQRQAKELGNTHRLYLAQGDFLGMNGNYSAGILEGVVHYYPDTQKWIE